MLDSTQSVKMFQSRCTSPAVQALIAAERLEGILTNLNETLQKISEYWDVQSSENNIVFTFSTDEGVHYATYISEVYMALDSGDSNYIINCWPIVNGTIDEANFIGISFNDIYDNIVNELSFLFGSTVALEMIFEGQESVGSADLRNELRHLASRYSGTVSSTIDYIASLAGNKNVNLDSIINMLFASIGTAEDNSIVAPFSPNKLHSSVGASGWSLFIGTSVRTISQFVAAIPEIAIKVSSVVGDAIASLEISRKLGNKVDSFFREVSRISADPFVDFNTGSFDDASFNCGLVSLDAWDFLKNGESYLTTANYNKVLKFVNKATTKAVAIPLFGATWYLWIDSTLHVGFKRHCYNTVSTPNSSLDLLGTNWLDIWSTKRIDSVFRLPKTQYPSGKPYSAINLEFYNYLRNSEQWMPVGIAALKGISLSEYENLSPQMWIRCSGVVDGDERAQFINCVKNQIPNTCWAYFFEAIISYIDRISNDANEVLHLEVSSELVGPLVVVTDDLAETAISGLFVNITAVAAVVGTTLLLKKYIPKLMVYAASTYRKYQQAIFDPSVDPVTFRKLQRKANFFNQILGIGSGAVSGISNDFAQSFFRETGNESIDGFTADMSELLRATGDIKSLIQR